MANTIAYLTTRSNFLQVSPDVPITKQRNPEKYDSPEVFEANKRELVTDLIVKAKQIDYLINSLPEPESEQAQVSISTSSLDVLGFCDELGHDFESQRRANPWSG